MLTTVSLYEVLTAVYIEVVYPQHYTVSQPTRPANKHTTFFVCLNNAIRRFNYILKSLDTPVMVHTLLNYAPELRRSYFITRCGRLRIKTTELCELLSWYRRLLTSSDGLKWVGFPPLSPEAGDEASLRYALFIKCHILIRKWIAWLKSLQICEFIYERSVVCIKIDFSEKNTT